MAEPRRTSIPVLHTRGTHYEVGYDIGRTFQSQIEFSMARNTHLNKVLLEKYTSSKVRKIYENVLRNVEKTYPQYIDELRGIAAGSKISFFKLFLLHIDEIVSCISGKEPHGGLLGSTSIICDQEHRVVLGYSLDSMPDLINQAYIVSAHVQEAAPRGRWGVAEEKFTALCLPGMLPGFFMSYNHHGFAYCVNTISTGIPVTDKQTPRHFLCRALLAVNNIFDVTEILEDQGHGISNGLSINMIFCTQEGVPLFHNAEVAPPRTQDLKSRGDNSTTESQLSVLTLSPGESLTICNKFLRLNCVPLCDQLPLWSSNHRHAVLHTLPRCESISSVVAILGDQTDLMYSFFRDGGGKDEARTIVIGLFNFNRKTWSIYTQNPKTSMPVVTMPMIFK